MTIRVEAPGFVAGLVLIKPWPRADHYVVDGYQIAPVLGYMVGWTSDRVFAYAKRRGWKVQQLP